MVGLRDWGQGRAVSAQATGARWGEARVSAGAKAAARSWEPPSRLHLAGERGQARPLSGSVLPMGDGRPAWTSTYHAFVWPCPAGAQSPSSLLEKRVGSGGAGNQPPFHCGTGRWPRRSSPGPWPVAPLTAAFTSPHKEAPHPHRKKEIWQGVWLLGGP